MLYDIFKDIFIDELQAEIGLLLLFDRFSQLIQHLKCIHSFLDCVWTVEHWWETLNADHTPSFLDLLP